MNERWHLSLGATISLATLAGCAGILGIHDIGPEADGGGIPPGNDAGIEAGIDSGPNPACAGLCGTIEAGGTFVDCGGCPNGETCGGGGPNLCGTGPCNPNCVGKGCGASDGCHGVCTGTCVDAAPPNNDIVLFGGDSGGTVLGDTWIWDGSTWTQSKATGPSARGGAALAGLGGTAVLFGGYTRANNVITSLADTWTWDGQAWAPHTTPTGPSARFNPAMATLNGAVYLFGGIASVTGPVLADMWKWDGTQWSEIVTTTNGPSARGGPAVGTVKGQMVIFGGTDNTSALGDTWTWDGNVWNQVLGAAPPPRAQPACGVVGARLVVFGGFTFVDAGPFAPLADAWSWDGAGWTALSQAPPTARWGPGSGSFNGQQLVLFGGQDPTTLGDSWHFDGNTWLQGPTAGPAPRFYAAMSGH